MKNKIILEIEPDDLKAIIEELEPSVQAENDSSEQGYWKARVDYLRGKLERGRWEMKRPEKMKRVEYDESEVGRGSENRVYNYGFDLGFKVGEVDGHNSACDAWEKFLPGEDEINDIINEYVEENQISQPRLAKAIAKRLEVK